VRAEDDIRTPRPGHGFPADQPALALTMDTYVQEPPSSSLREVAVCYYEIRTPDRDVGIVPIVPDACVDLIWVEHGCEVDSFATVPLPALAGLHAGPARRVLGVRLLPGALSRLTGTAVGTIDGHQAPLPAVAATALPDERIGTLTFSRFVAAMENWLTAALRADQERRTAAGQALMHHCVARIVATGGSVSVRSLAAETGFSSRYINATCHLHTGLSPRQLGQASRLQRALSHLRAGHRLTLATVAQLSGYSDQSHMNRSLGSLLHAPAGRLRTREAFAPTRDRRLPVSFYF